MQINNHYDQHYSFYHSTKWLKVADYIRRKYDYTCQLCGKRGTIVHHKDPLLESDYILKPAEKCYGEDNLTLVCKACHNQIHFNKEINENCYFDEDGNIQLKKEVDT